LDHNIGNAVHARAPAAFLTCTDADYNAQQMGETNLREHVVNGVSFDQVIVQQANLAQATRIASVQVGLGTLPGYFDGRSYALNQAILDAPPDSDLAAITGTEAELRAVALRLIADGRAATVLARFVAQWLHVDTDLRLHPSASLLELLDPQKTSDLIVNTYVLTIILAMPYWPAKVPKSEQLQIRVSRTEKAELQRRAKAAGMSVSSWVLHRAVPPKSQEFQRLIQELTFAEDASFVLAALNDFLAALAADEFRSALAEPPPPKLSALHRAYVAAMVEHAASRKRARVPQWALQTLPLPEPYFASQLLGLRLHLLASSPPAFRRRNLFVDATVGDRV
jgi:uncharacterized protein (DUF1778 family)